MAVVFAVAGALLLMVLQRLLWKKYWNKGLEGEIFFDRKEVAENDICQLTEIVTNRKAMPLPVLQVKFQMAREIRFLDTINTNTTDQSYRNDVFCMMPYQKVTRKMRVQCTKRGYYTIPAADLVTVNLLHTQLLGRPLPCNTELYVYPGRSTVRGMEIPFSHMMGQCVLNRFLYEDPFEFRGIRPYETTDSMKKINWRASAKTGELKVNQYHDTTQQEVTILLNLESEGIRVYDTLREESIRMTRTLIEWFAGKGIPVRFISNGRDAITGESVSIDFGSGTSHMFACQRQLARIDLAKGQEDFVHVMERFRQEGGGLWMMISTCQKESLQKAAAACKTTDANAQWIVPLHGDMKHKVSVPGVEAFYYELEV